MYKYFKPLYYNLNYKNKIYKIYSIRCYHYLPIPIYFQISKIYFKEFYILNFNLK
jgi:hypothetical protein